LDFTLFNVSPDFAAMCCGAAGNAGGPNVLSAVGWLYSGIGCAVLLALRRGAAYNSIT
jgi:hypothetical protein